MSASQKLADLIAKVRAGDQQAAAQLVAEYEPIVRRVVRLKLEDKRLRRNFDSGDFCQSVLASFFVRAAVGEFELNEPANLINLLITMTRNKVAHVARREYRQKRDMRRTTEADTQQLNFLQGTVETPSMILAGKELMDRAHALMSDEERQIASLRALGRSWDQVAEELGGTPQARRVQLMRTTQRITSQLGLGEDG